MFFRINSLAFLLPTIFVFSFSNISLPQGSYLDSLDGRFALQFQINENFSLSSFQGTIFSGKYNFSPRNAVRLGISINFGDLESDETSSRTDTNLVTTGESKHNSFNIIFKTQYIYTMSITNNIGFFVGAGPFLEYFKAESEAKWDTNIINSLRTYSSDRIGIGMDLINGVEWMFTGNMSLSAEYGLKFTYLTSEDKRTTSDSIGNGAIEESNNKVFSITGNHINFGITVYF